MIKNMLKKLTQSSNEETPEKEKEAPHNRQVSNFNAITLNPVTASKVYVLLDEEEMKPLPLNIGAYHLTRHMYKMPQLSTGDNKVYYFVNLQYLNLSGVKLM